MLRSAHQRVWSHCCKAIVPLADASITEAAGTASRLQSCSTSGRELLSTNLYFSRTFATGEQNNQLEASTSSSAPGAQPNVVADRVVGAAKKILPSWLLRSIMPGGEDLVKDGKQGDQPAEGESKEGKSADDQKKQERQQTLKHLEETSTMDLQGYYNYCQQMQMGDEQPKLRLPKVPVGHPEFARLYGMADFSRLQFIRIKQHMAIVGEMSQAERDRVLDEGEAILEDRIFQDTIALRVPSFKCMHLEVRDCLKEFFESRKRARKLLRWHRDMGRPIPKTARDQKQMLKEVDPLEAQEEYFQKLAKQDRANCPVSQSTVKWAGAAVTCGLTGLQWAQCCGARVPGKYVPPLGEKKKKVDDGSNQDIYQPGRKAIERGIKAPQSEWQIRRMMRKGLGPRFEEL